MVFAVATRFVATLWDHISHTLFICVTCLPGTRASPPIPPFSHRTIARGAHLHLECVKRVGQRAATALHFLFKMDNCHRPRFNAGTGTLLSG
jgi:hypothetical protein